MAGQGPVFGGSEGRADSQAPGNPSKPDAQPRAEALPEPAPGELFDADDDGSEDTSITGLIADVCRKLG